MGWFWSRGSNPTTAPIAPPQASSQTTDPSMALFLQHLAAAEEAAAASTDSASASPPISLAESQYPTTMSCRQAFDLAIGCQSMAGQMRHIYRYGKVRLCSEQWNDFWFCMRLKGTSGPVSEKMIHDHYRHKEYQKYHAPGRRSSQDVWESRQQGLPAHAFFNEPIEPPTESDEEWRRKEIERRRRIRGNMGDNSKT